MRRAFPGQIGVSTGCRRRPPQSRGWVEDTGMTVDSALPRLLEDGAAFVIYTDIERDGMQCGVNVAALETSGAAFHRARHCGGRRPRLKT